MPSAQLEPFVPGLVVAMALGAGPASAWAQVNVRGALELSSTFAADDAGTLLVFAPAAGIEFGLAESISLGANFPVAVGHFSNVGAIAALGNPRLGASFGFAPGPLELELRAGFGVPMARPGNDAFHTEGFWRIARGTAASAQGLYEAPRWIEKGFSALVGGSLRVREGIIFGGVHSDLGPISDGSARFFARGTAEVGVRPSDWAELGLRLQIAGLTETNARARIVCIARTPEECNEGPDPFAEFRQIFPDGGQILSEGAVVVSVAPGVRFFLPPMEVGLAVTINLTDLVALGVSDVGPGLAFDLRVN